MIQIRLKKKLTINVKIIHSQSEIQLSLQI